jgi:hypothetical protein
MLHTALKLAALTTANILQPAEWRTRLTPLRTRFRNLPRPAAPDLYVIAALDRSEYSRVVHICCCPSTLAGGSVERGWCRMLHAVHFVVRGDHRVLPC